MRLLVGMAAKKSTTKTKGKAKVKKVMHEYKHGELKSGSGKKVTGRKQAIAIGLNEARESGAKIPRKGASKSKSHTKTKSAGSHG